MSTAGQLNDRPKTDLANLAKRRGIRGYEAMNKAELIKALSRTDAKVSKPAPAKPVPQAARPAATATLTNAKSPVWPRSSTANVVTPSSSVSRLTHRGCIPEAHLKVLPYPRTADPMTQPLEGQSAGIGSTVRANHVPERMPKTKLMRASTNSWMIPIARMRRKESRRSRSSPRIPELESRRRAHAQAVVGLPALQGSLEERRQVHNPLMRRIALVCVRMQFRGACEAMVQKRASPIWPSHTPVTVGNHNHRQLPTSNSGPADTARRAQVLESHS